MRNLLAQSPRGDFHIYIGPDHPVHFGRVRAGHINHNGSANRSAVVKSHTPHPVGAHRYCRYLAVKQKLGASRRCCGLNILRGQLGVTDKTCGWEKNTPFDTPLAWLAKTGVVYAPSRGERL